MRDRTHGFRPTLVRAAAHPLATSTTAPARPVGPGPSPRSAAPVVRGADGRDPRVERAILAALTTPSLAPIASAELAAELASLVTQERPVEHILQALAELDLAARLGRWSSARIEAKLPRYILGVRPRGETRAGITYAEPDMSPPPPPVDTRMLAQGAAQVIAGLQTAC